MRIMSLFLVTKGRGKILTPMLCLLILTSQAQDVKRLFHEGLCLEKRFEDSAALKKYEQILSVDPDHVEALSHSSRMLSNIGGRLKNKAIKKQKIEQSRALALRAIQLDCANKDAHLNYVIALGLLADAAESPAEKIAHAKTIKAEADLLLRLDSLYAPAFYILGKLNLSLATLSWLEKLACDALYGGIPKEASLENAIRCFDKAIALQPDYILFYYNKALAHYYTRNCLETKRALDRALNLPLKEPDDKIRIEQCLALLNELKRSETSTK